MVQIGPDGSRLQWKRHPLSLEALAATIPATWIRDAVTEAARSSQRDGKLPAPVVVWLVLVLGLFRRLSYRNVVEKLRDSWMVRDRWRGKPPSSSAVTQARDRLGVEPLRRLFNRCTRFWLTETKALRFHGRRVLGLDGSTAKTPDSAVNQRYFGLPGANRGRAGYPQLRWVSLLDLGTHLLAAVRMGPYTVSEMSLAHSLIDDVGAGSLVVMDRGFAAYGFLWDLAHRKAADFVVRIQANMRPRLIHEIGPGDAIVRVQLPHYYRRKRPDMPRFWALRMIEYTAPGARASIRLLTTVLDEQTSADDFAKLYHLRWEHELGIDEIKTHLCDCTTVNRPVLFRSMTPMRVEQEAYGVFLSYNAVRRIVIDAAASRECDPLSLSFTAALTRIREAVREMTILETRALGCYYDQLIQSIARAYIRRRHGRQVPRVVKVKMSKFRLKQRLRAA